MISEYGDVTAIKLHGGPFAGGDEYSMALSRQVDDGREEFWFTVHGRHDGKPVQFTFDVMDRSELEDMRAAIDLILEDDKARPGRVTG